MNLTKAPTSISRGLHNPAVRPLMTPNPLTVSSENKYAYFYFTDVNRRVNPYLIKDNELLDAVNFWTETTIGAKKVRPGLTPFLDRIDSNPVTGLFYAKFPNGNVRLARVSGGKIYAADPNAAATWGTAKFSTTNTLVRPDYTQLAGKVHIVSQVSGTESHYIEWDNTDTMTDTAYTSGTDLVVPYQGSCIQQFHQRIYTGSTFATPDTFKSRLSWSTIDYANAGTTPASPWTTLDTDVTTANFRDIELDYKGGIIKLTSLNDRLNIYKEQGVYKYNEDSVQELFGLSPYVGSISTMDESNEDYFFTNEGFFKTEVNPYLSVSKAVKTIGDGWYPVIKEILKNGIDTTKMNSLSVNFLYFCYMGDVQYDGRVVKNACWCYNAYYDELYLFSFAYDIRSMGYYVDASGNKQIVMGDVNGFTYKFDYNASDDAGLMINAMFRTKYFFFDSPHKKNQFTEIFPYATLGAELEISADTDFQNMYTEFTQLAGLEDSIRVEPSKFGQFNEFSMKVAWNGRGKRPEFYGMILNIKEDSERFT